MEILKIIQILQEDNREFKNSDCDLQEIALLALNHRQQIKIVTGIGLNQKATPIQIIKRFLTQLGYDLRFVRLSKRLRLYKLVQPQDNRENVFPKISQFFKIIKGGNRLDYPPPQLYFL